MTKNIRAFNEKIGEIEGFISELTNKYKDVTISFSVKFGDYVIRVSSLIEVAAETCFTDLCQLIGQKVYSVENMNLPATIVALLKLNRAKLSLAESFTGGLVASGVVSVEGASEVFHEGYVTYSDDVKNKVLFVSFETLKTKTAVSSQAAAEMVEGLLRISSSDYAISTTGYASAVEENAFLKGLCYIGVATPDRTDVFEYRFEGDRDYVRRTGANAALFQLYKRIKWPYDFANIYINKIKEG